MPKEVADTIPPLFSSLSSPNQESAELKPPQQILESQATEVMNLLEDFNEKFDSNDVKEFTDLLSNFADANFIDSLGMTNDVAQALKKNTKAFSLAIEQLGGSFSKAEFKRPQAKSKNSVRRERSFSNEADKKKKNKIKYDHQRDIKKDLAKPESGLLNFTVDHNINVPIVDRITSYFTGHQFHGNEAYSSQTARETGFIPTNYNLRPGEDGFEEANRTYNTHTLHNAARDNLLNGSVPNGLMYDLFMKNPIFRFFFEWMENLSDHGLLVVVMCWIAICEMVIRDDKSNSENKSMWRTLYKTFYYATLVLVMVRTCMKILNSSLQAESILIYSRAINEVLRVNRRLESDNAFLRETLAFERGESSPEEDNTQGVHRDATDAFADFDEGVGFGPAAPESFADFAEPMSEFVTFMLNASLGVKTKAPLANTLIGCFKTTKVQRDNTISFMKWVSEKISKMIEFCLGENEISKFFEIDTVTDPKTMLIIDQAKSLLSDSNANLDILDPTRPQKLLSLVTSAKEHLRLMDKTSFDFKMLTQVLMELEKRSVSIEGSLKALSGDRVEPVGILFHGKPGTKKAVLLDRLNHLLLYATVPDEWKEEVASNPAAFTYVLPTDKYHDTYDYKKWIIVADDIYQKPCTENSEDSDAMFTIKGINSKAHVLRVATANMKNLLYNRSAFMVGSTNMSFDNFHQLRSVRDWKAVARRWHIAIEVMVNPDYCGGGQENLDNSVFTEVDDDTDPFTATTIPDDYWIFKRKRFDVSVGKWFDDGYMTLEQILHESIATYQSHVKHYYVNKHAALSTFEKMKTSIDKFKRGKNSTTHVGGSWYSKDDPLLNKFHDRVKTTFSSSAPSNIARPESSNEPDLDMITIEPRNSPPSEASSDDSFETTHSSDLHWNVAKYLQSDGLDPGYTKLFSEFEMKRFMSDKTYRDGVTNELMCRSDLQTSITIDYNVFASLDMRSELQPIGPYKEGCEKAHQILAHSHFIKPSWFISPSGINMERWKTIASIWDSIIDPSISNSTSKLYFNMAYEAFEKFGHVEYASNYRQNMITIFTTLLLQDYETATDIFRTFDNIGRTRNHLYLVLNRRRRDLQDPIDGKSDWRAVFRFDTYKVLADRIKSKLRSWYRRFLIFLQDNPYLIVFIPFVPLILRMVYKAIKGIWNFFTGTDDSQSAEPQSKDMKSSVPKKKKELKKPKKPMKHQLTLADHAGALPESMPEAAFSFDLFKDIDQPLLTTTFGQVSQVNDIISCVFRKYYYIMYLTLQKTSGSSVRQFSSCINVKGQLFAMNFHNIYMLNEMTTDEDYLGGYLTLVNPHKNCVMHITIEDLYNNFETTSDCAAVDICGFIVPSSQPHSKGAYSYFITEADLSILLKSSSLNIAITGADLQVSGNVKHVNVMQKEVKARFTTRASPILATWSDDPKAQVYRLPRSLIYEPPLGPGSCGNFLATRDGNFANRCLMGIHAAGTKSEGIATIVTKDLLDQLIEILEDYTLVAFEDEEDPGYTHPVEAVPQGRLVSFARFKPNCEFTMPGQTSLKRSKMYGELPEPYDKTDQVPMKLRPYYEDGVLKGPVENTMNKYGAYPPIVAESIVKRAALSYENMLNQVMSNYPRERKTLSLEEALHAYHNMKTVASSTSPGFPMNNPNFENLKKAYYDAFNSGNLIEADEVRQRIAILVDDAIDKYKRGVRPFFVYVDFAKDEVRKRGKDTRNIAGAPFILLILFRMYFGAFFDAFVEYNLEIGSAIGVNPYSSDWDRIGKLLSKFGTIPGKEEPQVLAGDHKDYDTREQPFIMLEVRNIINNWYGINNPDNIIRSRLWAEITNSRHHYMNYLIEWFSAMPPGNPLTAMINTMYNHINVRCCWIYSELEINLFNDYVYVIVLGDDIAMSVHPDFLPVFNEITLPAYMDEVGMIYTTETKDEALYESRNLSEIEFLKRRWIYCKRYGRFIAPLRMDSIASMLNWTKRGSNSDQISVDNISIALREFSLHGKETYRDWFQVLNDIKNEKYPNYSYTNPPSSDFNEELRTVLSLDFIW